MNFKCSKCSRTHSFGSCPVYMKKCLNCRETNHYAAQSYLKNFQEIDQEHDEKLFVHSIIRIDMVNSIWFETLDVQIEKIAFKVDTGYSADENSSDHNLSSFVENETVEEN